MSCSQIQVQKATLVVVKKTDACLKVASSQTTFLGRLLMLSKQSVSIMMEPRGTPALAGYY